MLRPNKTIKEILNEVSELVVYSHPKECIGSERMS